MTSDTPGDNVIVETEIKKEMTILSVLSKHRKKDRVVSGSEKLVT